MSWVGARRHGGCIRLSIHRNQQVRHPGPRGTRDLTLFINNLNATWDFACQNNSVPVSLLTSTRMQARGKPLAFASKTLDPLANAVLPVSAVGGSTAPQWLDVGREFSEKQETKFAKLWTPGHFGARRGLRFGTCGYQCTHCSRYPRCPAARRGRVVVVEQAHGHCAAWDQDIDTGHSSTPCTKRSR